MLFVSSKLDVHRPILHHKQGWAGISAVAFTSKYSLGCPRKHSVCSPHRVNFQQAETEA